MVERSADVAQLVEHQLPKLRVAGSIPVVRSSEIKQRPQMPAMRAMAFGDRGARMVAAVRRDGVMVHVQKGNARGATSYGEYVLRGEREDRRRLLVRIRAFAPDATGRP
jgi:hypothetical protein